MRAPTYKQIKGTLAEYIAMVYLMLHGFRPIYHSYKGSYAEVDIVATKTDKLCVVEVKYRATQQAAHMAIHPAQRGRLQQQAQALQTKFDKKSNSLDVVLLFSHWPFIEYVPNAWEMPVKF